MTVLAAALVAAPLLRRAPVAALVSALAIPAVSFLLYTAASNYNWAADAAARTKATAAGSDSAPVARFKERIARNPGDPTAWVGLGDSYLADERFDEARESYREAIRLSPEVGDDILLAYAEASILSDSSSLAGEAGQIVDQVLARNPRNPRALWYGGMAALSRGDHASARRDWSALLELAPPPQVRDVISRQLARLEEQPAAAALAAEPTRIPVRVSVRRELISRIDPSASLFLIARAPAGSGPPLAVIRRNGVSLPLQIEISDADSMVPGRSMGALAEINLTARMANDGEALPAKGDVFGEAIWKRGSTQTGPVEILMDRVIQ